jgi:hypothetical protein
MDATPLVRPCPDCGGKVSVRASSCPHCGAPTAHAARTETPEPASPPVASSDGSWRLLILAPVALCVVVGTLYLAVKPPKGDLETLQRDVTRDFLDPASAELRNVRWNDAGNACGEVNGSNAFGGKTGFRRFYAMENADGDGYSVVIEGRSSVDDSMVSASCP